MQIQKRKRHAIYKTRNRIVIAVWGVGAGREKQGERRAPGAASETKCSGDGGEKNRSQRKTLTGRPTAKLPSAASSSAAALLANPSAETQTNRAENKELLSDPCHNFLYWVSPRATRRLSKHALSRGEL